ncbi:hypothetical protein FKW77_009803 [Venturia effusa]|uniref:Uncharacterized protein n=1 Tax=Venturia effusa TaxID=50376 RepID=A0A517LBQ9_9PEZI|nr:hypothetical protein FKW77_009803 [Venturia effusa]
MAAFMTFTQQAVAVAQQQIQVEPIARLPRALQYSDPDTGEVVWEKLVVGEERMDLYMRAAIKSGAVHNYQSLSNVTAVCSSVEDVSSTIVIDHMQNDIPILTVQALKDINRSPPEGSPGVRFTLWVDTLHFHSSHDLLAQNSSATTRAPHRGVAPLTETYILYYPACENKEPGNEIITPVRSNPKEWRALKGAMNICLLTLQANETNGLMKTTVIDEILDLDWKDKPSIRVRGDDVIQTCADYKGEEFCFWGQFWSQYGRRIDEIFNGTAVLIENGDDTHDPEDWMITLADDILGSSPSSCNGSKSLHMKGLEKRVNSVAISMRNA